MKRKCRSKRGFTLTELLAAVAILGLLSAAVATGVPVAVRAYRQVTTSAEAGVLCSTLSTALSDELRFATNPRNTESGLVFDSPVFGAGVSVGKAEVTAGTLVQQVVTVGGTRLLGDKAYSSGLSAEAAVSYDGLYEIQITVSDATGRLWAAAAFSVAPLNG